MTRVDGCSSEASQRVVSELRTAFFKYLDAYFVRRDLPVVLDIIAPDITCYGTGIDEVGYKKDEVSLLFSRDISQAPNAFCYKVENVSIQPLSDNAGIVCCHIHIATEIANQKLALNGLRLTLAFSGTAADWRIRHKHISFPTTSVHEEGEAYPLKEMEERNQALQRMVDEKTRRLDEALAEVSRLAITDKLTGLFNRTKMDEALGTEIQRALRYQRPLSLILMDIDHFKIINDKYGHLEGDRALSAFAGILSAETRATDLLGRWGGEEFLIICPETDSASTLAMAEKLRSATEKCGIQLAKGLTASFGIASVRSGDTPAALLLRADQAMYQAKKNGRNRVVAMDNE